MIDMKKIVTMKTMNDETVKNIVKKVKRETAENMKLAKPKKDGEMTERTKEIVQREVDNNAD